MDDGWGNILYLIVAALFGIVSMLRKKKQANAVSLPTDDENDQQATEEPIGGFDSILGALLGEEMPNSNVQAAEEVEPVRQESMMEEYARIEKEKAMARHEVTRTTFKDIDPIKGIDEIEVEEDEIDEVDWRKAIIYKEILDRKYN